MRIERTAALMLLAAIVVGSGRAQAAQPLCTYDVTLLDAEAKAVEVAVACDTPVTGFSFAEAFPAPWVQSFTAADGTALPRAKGNWQAPTQDGLRAARYRLDLDGMARALNSYNSAVRVGASVYVDLAGVIAVPPSAEDAELAIRFAAPNGGEIATALPAADGPYTIRVGEVEDATALILGRLKRRRIAVPGPLTLADGETAQGTRDASGTIDLVMMDGALAASDEDIAAWVHATALAEADFWRGFPVRRCTVVILPAAGAKNVPFGRVTAVGGIMALILVGSEIKPRQLYDEWVLVHEFIHLGTPYIRDTGAWLNEGLATYLEPIIRYRAGWRSADSVWQEWTGWMGRGLGPMTHGLQKSIGGGIYWGGALYALSADIELRRLSGGALGLEDCIRAILRQAGDVRTSATTMAVLAIGDGEAPEPVLTRLAQAHLGSGAPMDLDALFAALGVHSASTGQVDFDDAAPLAQVRRWLLEGGPRSRVSPIPLPAG